MNPIMIGLLLAVAQKNSTDADLVTGVLGLIVVSGGGAAVNAQFDFQYQLLSTHITGALSMKIQRKSLEYPLIRSQYFQLGDILNLLQVDVLQINLYFQALFRLIVFPFVVLIAIMLYFSFVGEQAIVGIAFAFLQLLISFIFGKVYGMLQEKFMFLKDTRMRGLDEMMYGIKTIKYNSYETYFQQRVRRQKELSILMIQKIMENTISLITYMFPLMVYYVTIQFYTITGVGELLILQSLYGLLNQFLSLLPTILTDFVVSLQSMKRLGKFLLKQPIYEIKNQPKNNQQNIAIEITDASFTWKESTKQEGSAADNLKEEQFLLEQGLNSKEDLDVKEKFMLDGINLQIQNGQFVAVVGETGCGKSSLIYTMLGELLILPQDQDFQKHVKINGTISYASQDPWILQDTIKNNVTYGQSFNNEQYQKVLDVCSFKEDLNFFKDGDETLLAEKGDSLSGGQRKRISLARSVYQEADIYLFDDVLSAVDIKVIGHIVNEALIKFLHGKTRLLFCNSLNNLQKVDRIILIRDGRIVGNGTWKDIIQDPYAQTLVNMEELHGSPTQPQVPATMDKVQNVEDSIEALVGESRVINIEPKIQEIYVDPITQMNEIKQNASDSKKENVIIKIEQPATDQKEQEPNSLVSQEDQCVGGVKYEIYQQLFWMFGSWKTVIWFLLIGTVYTVTGIYGFISLNDTQQDTQFAPFDAIQISKCMTETIKEILDCSQHLKDQAEEAQKGFYLFIFWYTISNFSSYFLKVSGTIIGINMSKILCNNIIRNLLLASFSKFYNKVMTGQIMNRLSQDIYMVDAFLTPFLMNAIDIGFLLIQTVLIFFVMKAYLSIPVLIALFIGVFKLSFLFVRSLREMTRIEAVSQSPILSFLSEVIRGAVYVRTCLVKQIIYERHKNNQDVELKNKIASAGIENWFNVSLGNFITIIIALIIVVMQYDGRQGDSLTFAIVAAINLSSAFANLVYMILFLELKMVNFERCFNLAYNIPLEPEYLEDDQKIDDGNRRNDLSNLNMTEQDALNQSIVEQNRSMFSDQKQSNQQQIELNIVNHSVTIDNLRGGNQQSILDFQNVSFKYRADMDPAVKNVSFEVISQQQIGVIGRTGAGQTSILLGLSRIIDQSTGKLLINSKNSQELSKTQLRQLISVIPQDPFIFEGSLRDNLDPFKQFSDTDITSSVQKVGIDQSKVLQNGLESIITHLGSNLSIGERQLISIARCVLRQADIILIDQATSNIDKEIENLVTKTMEIAFQEKTVLTIAHKIKTIMGSDQILVFDHGIVLEYDNPDQLLQNPQSHFSNIVNLVNQAGKTSIQ